MSKVKSYKSRKFERAGLTHQEIEEIKEAFSLFDSESEGRINPQVMARAMQSLGIDVQHKRIFKQVHDFHIGNIDNDGMTFEEFLDIIASNMNDKLDKSDINRIFQLFDRDHNGKISVIDLKAISAELGEGLSDIDLAYMIERADVDRDGEVSAEEFYSIVTKVAFY